MKNIIDSGHAPGATRPSGADRCPEGKRDDAGRTKLREVFEKRPGFLGPRVFSNRSATGVSVDIVVSDNVRKGVFL